MGCCMYDMIAMMLFGVVFAWLSFNFNSIKIRTTAKEDFFTLVVIMDRSHSRTCFQQVSDYTYVSWASTQPKMARHSWHNSSSEIRSAT